MNELTSQELQKGAGSVSGRKLNTEYWLGFSIYANWIPHVPFHPRERPFRIALQKRKRSKIGELTGSEKYLLLLSGQGWGCFSRIRRWERETTVPIALMPERKRVELGFLSI